MSLVKTEKRTVAHLAVRLDNKLIAVADAVDRERQAVAQSGQLFLKLILVATPIVGYAGKSLQDTSRRRLTVFLNATTVKLAN